MRVVRTRPQDSSLPLHRLLSRQHAHRGKVNTAPTRPIPRPGNKPTLSTVGACQFARTVDAPP